MTKRVLATLLVLVVALVARPMQAQDFPFALPYFENVGDRDSIPSGVVTSMIQTPDGLLWLGTQTGLLRYDGYRFLHFQFDPSQRNSLPGNFITALAASPDGQVLIGTSNDGFSIYDPYRRQFSNHRMSVGGLVSNSVGAIAVSTAGYWIGTNQGVSRYQPGSNQYQHYAMPVLNDEQASQRVRSLLIDSNDLLWAGSSDGLFQFDQASDRFVRFALAGQDPFAGQSINALFADSEGGIWVGTREHGVARITPDLGAIVRRSSESLDGRPGLATDRIQSFAQPTAASMWVATTVGLHQLDLHDLQVQTHWLSDKEIPGSLAFDAMGALLRDHAGLIWLGTWGGQIQRTNPANRAIRSIRRDVDGSAGLSYADVHAVLEYPDGNLWVGTGGNGIDLIDPVRGRVGGYRPGNVESGELGDGVVIALELGEDQSVWVGTQRGGLFQISPVSGEIRRLGEAGTVTDLLFTSDQTLWVGGSEGLQRIRPGSEVRETVYDSNGRAIAGQIIPMIEDSQGRIWSASASGLRVLEPGADSFLVIEHEPDRADSLVHNSVYGLLEDRQGQLWVATEQGVDRLISRLGSLARFDHVSAELGAPGRDLGANLLEDRQGRIWTDTAVINLDLKRIDRLSAADGADVGTTWFGAYAQMADGRLLSGGTEGLLLIDPDQFQISQLQPPLVATEYRVNGLSAALDPVRGIELQPDQRSFSLSFAALDYSAPDALRYRYQLRGFDQDWIPTDAARRVASYSNLWPGDYQLLVEGSNRSGVFAEQTLVVPVKVLPAVWQSLWFQLLLAAAAIGLISLAMRWRTQRLQQRSVELDALVRARTAELEAANQSLTQSNADLELARRHLEQTQGQLVFQEKMASLGQLVAGVAHEVNTPLGIAITASSFLGQRNQEFQGKLVQQNLSREELQQFASDTAQSTKLLAEHLSRAAHLVRQFKQVSVDRQQGDRRQVGFDDFLIELLSSLKPLFNGWPVSLEYAGAPKVAIETFPGAIGQVITNLLQNALSHGFPEGRNGHVWVSAGLNTVGDTSVAEIRVRDDGVGMDESLKSQIFEPFFTTSRSRGGTGLGLHIVYNVVTSQLDGSISVHSETDVGSEFVIRFPIKLVLSS